jgi:hypothetical protein
LHNLIAILPQGSHTNAAAAKEEDRYYSDDEGGVALLGLVHAGGHLIIHDAFSYFEII